MDYKPLIHQVTKTFCSTVKLYWTTHAAHLNVEGQDFYELHKILEKQYEDIWESIDSTAEKIRQLDAYAPSSLEFIVYTGEQFEDCSKFPVHAMAHSLMVSQEKMTASINASIQEAKKVGREDITSYFGARWEAHSKMRWMLRATAKRYNQEPDTTVENTVNAADV